jgi:hypothetical protein
MWVKLTGLQPDGALVPKDDPNHALQVRIQQLDSFIDVVEYEALHKILHRSLAGIPIDSDASDNAMLAKIAHRNRNIKAAKIMETLMPGLNASRTCVVGSAPEDKKKKKRKKKKRDITQSVANTFEHRAREEDNNANKRSFTSLKNEDIDPPVRPTKKAKKSFTEALMKEVSKFMAKQKEEKEMSRSKVKKIPPTANGRLSNWKIAMRRNWKASNIEKALLPFTIRRTQLHDVRTLSFPKF